MSNMEVCTADFDSFLYTQAMPVAGVSAVATLSLIVLVMMFGKATSNPKLSEWSKTEIVQLPMTIASIIMIVLVMDSFCAIDFNSVRAIFGKAPVEPPKPVLGFPVSTYTNVYDAAESYLFQGAKFSHQALVVARYHHEVYNILVMRSAYLCDWWCIFGQSGTTVQALSGYSGRLNLMGMLFNSDLAAYLSDLNSLFILTLVRSGMLVMLLPIGIFLRSMPFMRTFGSVFIAVAMSFMLVYPATLAIFSMMDGIFSSPLKNAPQNCGMDLDAYFQDESRIYNDEKGYNLDSGVLLHDDELLRHYLPCGRDYPIETAEYAAYAFIAGVFIPTIALLSAAASVRFIARFYGEEIDLSKIVQMV